MIEAYPILNLQIFLSYMGDPKKSALSKKFLSNLTSQLSRINRNEVSVADLLKQYSECREASAGELLRFFDEAINCCGAQDLKHVVDFARTLEVSPSLSFQDYKPFIDKLLARKEDEDFIESSVLLSFCDFFCNCNADRKQKDMFLMAFGDMEFLVTELLSKLEKVGEYARQNAAIKDFCTTASNLWEVSECGYLVPNDGDMEGVAEVLESTASEDEVLDVMVKLGMLAEQGHKVQFYWKLLNVFSQQLVEKFKDSKAEKLIAESLEDLYNSTNDQVIDTESNPLSLCLGDVAVEINFKDGHGQYLDDEEVVQSALGSDRLNFLNACLKDGASRSVGENLSLLRYHGIEISFQNPRLNQLADYLARKAEKELEERYPGAGVSKCSATSFTRSVQELDDEIWL